MVIYRKYCVCLLSDLMPRHIVDMSLISFFRYICMLYLTFYAADHKILSFVPSVLAYGFHGDFPTFSDDH